MEFEIDDVVMLAYTEGLFIVSGVIHDDKKVFVQDPAGRYYGGKEFWVPFKDVIDHWRKLVRPGAEEDE